MKILFVMDQIDDLNNGATISCLNFGKALKELGHKVYYAGCGSLSENKFVFDEKKFGPIKTNLLRKEGICFAKPDDDFTRTFIRDFDIIHLCTPFELSQSILKLAKKYDIPVTAGYHIQPENATYNFGLKKNKDLNNKIYDKYRLFFNEINHIHCPTKFIADKLKEHGYNSKMHIFSNSISDEFTYSKEDKPDKYKETFVITMVGKLTKQKGQSVLIDAVENSKYEEFIQLVFAGDGPERMKLRKKGKKLSNKPFMKFYSRQDLKYLLSYTDLYVHTSNAEIESISCMEAMACGLVPIIADSPKSATPKFALSKESLFKPNDADDLAEKIDYWIEHTTLRQEYEKKYAELIKDNYPMDKSVKQLEAMFNEAIKEVKM